MLRGEKVLITGPAGRIALGIARSLAADNEVWGIARFSDPATREQVEALGVTTRTARPGRAATSATCRPTSPTCCTSRPTSAPTTTSGRCGSTPKAPGFILEHCRQAKAALVMSTLSVYKPHPDPWHAFREDDPLGDVDAAGSAAATRCRRSPARQWRATAPARSACPSRSPAWARPTATPAACRPGTSTRSPRASRSWRGGIRCRTRRSTKTTSAISSKLLVDAATVPATIVNWCGDEPVSVQEWSAYFGELLGVSAEGRRAADSRRVHRVGRRRHQAHVDHRAVPGRLARGLPPDGRALLSRPARRRRTGSGGA